MEFEEPDPDGEEWGMDDDGDEETLSDEDDFGMYDDDDEED